MHLDRFRLDGRTAIVTGVGPGIGAHAARAFAEVGANGYISTAEAGKLIARLDEGYHLVTGWKHRGKGYGKALLTHLAQTAVAADAARVDWSVLDWNKPSIDFYDSLGANAVKGWYTYRLEGDALKALGKR